MSEENLFSILGKYVQRQNENLLTQSLAALFNNSRVFKHDLLDLFRRRSEGKRLGTTGEPRAVTQRSRSLKKGRILVDLEIHCGGDPSPEYVVEAKLTAPLSRKQVRHYAEFLEQGRGKSRLVLITRAGVDTELKELLPKSTLWLTWTEIAELAVRPAYRSKTERFLCGQFYEMLKERGIPMVPSVTSGEYKKLASLNRFVRSKSTRSLHESSIDTINNVIARMREFADHNWSSLQDDGYKRYARLYAVRPSKGNGVKSPHAEIVVGFYLWKKRKHVHGRDICLELDCNDMRLSVWGGWELGEHHPEYDDDDDQWGEYLKKWTRVRSFSLFKEPFDDAQKEIQTQLEKCLRQFKKSRYYNA
jgi:hypothetical protein